MVTHGVSPKVLVPALVSVGIGALLLIVGIAVHDQALKAAGAGVLLAAAGHGAIGYAAPSGPVAVDAVPQDSPPVVASVPRAPRKKAGAR